MCSMGIEQWNGPKSLIIEKLKRKIIGVFVTQALQINHQCIGYCYLSFNPESITYILSSNVIA